MINAVVLVIIGIALAVLVVQALWTHGGGNSVLYLAGVVLYGGAALTGVLGLWPWRRMRWLRRVMFGWNGVLAAAIGLLGLGSVAVVAYRNPSDGLLGAALILLAMLPACSVLLAYRTTPRAASPATPRTAPQ